MNGVGIVSHPPAKVVHVLASEILEKSRIRNPDYCERPTREEDAIVPGLIVAVGLLSALTCSGFWPGHKLAILGVSLAVGLLISPVVAVGLPHYIRWMLPFLSLAGGGSIAISFVRTTRETYRVHRLTGHGPSPPP